MVAQKGAIKREKEMRSKLLFILALVLASSTIWSATVEPVLVSEDLTVNLVDSKGSTFFELMTQENGIRDKMNQAFQHPFEVLSLEKIGELQDKFSTKVWRSLYDEELLTPVLEKEAGKEFSNKSLNAKLTKTYKVFPPWDPGMFLSMAGGSAVLVHLNEKTYYYNVGYDDGGFANAEEAMAAERERQGPGEKLKEPVGINSGRSYAAGPSHPADDASYVDYLKNLRAYLDNRDDLAPFYKAILAILVKSDPSALDDLDSRPLKRTVSTDRGDRAVTIDGQSLVADFMAVYTAELYRHLFASLKKHDWENALAELTFVSSYSERAGLVQDVDGQIVEGTPSNWRYIGTQGSGIGGKAGINRRSFQSKVCDAARKLKIDSLRKVDAMTKEVVERLNKNRKERAVTNRDCFKSVMITLNDPQFQSTVKENAKVLTNDFVSFLGTIRERHDEITQIIAPD